MKLKILAVTILLIMISSNFVALGDSQNKNAKAEGTKAELDKILNRVGYE